MTDAFDADVLIYAAGVHPLGPRIEALLPATADPFVAIGSVMLYPELLSKPLREADLVEQTAMSALLARLDLFPVDEATAELAATLGGRHRLRAVDATHLATAVRAGADRFITNNRRDFPTSIEDIDVVYPDQLPEPAS